MLYRIDLANTYNKGEYRKTKNLWNRNDLEKNHLKKTGVNFSARRRQHLFFTCAYLKIKMRKFKKN